MPKAQQQTPASVLTALIEEYQLNPFSLSTQIGLSNSSVRNILSGKSGVTVPTALRFSKFFGQEPAFWLDLQLQADMQEAANDKDLQAALKAIPKAKKPTEPAKAKPEAKAAKAAKPAAAKAKKEVKAAKGAKPKKK